MKLMLEENSEEPKSSIGCFITTAVVESSNLPDNCHELQVMRPLRDTYMQETQDRQGEIAEYYRIAPCIVAAVGANHNAAEEWRRIMTQ